MAAGTFFRRVRDWAAGKLVICHGSRYRWWGSVRTVRGEQTINQNRHSLPARDAAVLRTEQHPATENLR